MLRNDPGYDRETLGEPINQEDLLGTLVAFTVVVVEALERFGVPLTVEQRDAYVRLWLTAGVLLGISPELLESHRPGARAAITWDELIELRDAIARRQAGASVAGRVLMAALLAEQSEAMPYPLKTLPRACTRYLIGDENCEYLAVPAAGWAGELLRPLPLLNRVLFGRVYYDLAGWLSAKVTRRMYRAWIARAAGPGPHPWRYEPVVRSWKLEAAPARAWRVARHPVRAHRDRRVLRTAFAIR
jgi:hypothetical protein